MLFLKKQDCTYKNIFGKQMKKWGYNDRILGNCCVGYLWFVGESLFWKHILNKLGPEHLCDHLWSETTDRTLSLHLSVILVFQINKYVVKSEREVKHGRSESTYTHNTRIHKEKHRKPLQDDTHMCF